MKKPKQICIQFSLILLSCIFSSCNDVGLKDIDGTIIVEDGEKAENLGNLHVGDTVIYETLEIKDHAPECSGDPSLFFYNVFPDTALFETNPMYQASTTESYISHDTSDENHPTTEYRTYRRGILF